MKKLPLVICFGCVASVSHAGVSWFNSLGSWQPVAGTTTFSEDFSGFVTDTSFASSAASFNGGSISQQGPGVSNFNMIDVTPTSITGNSTNQVSMWTEADSPTSVRIDFSTLTSAFGFQSWDAASSERTRISIYNGASLLGSFDLTNVSGAFLGFVLDSGDVATSVVFSAINPNGSFINGETAALDNFVGVSAMTPVPEPFTMTLLGMGALVAYRKRMKTTKA